MSFFVTEHFNLPNSALQDSVETDTAGNGTIYTYDGWGKIATFEDADGALIVPDEGLTQAQFATTPFRVSLKWKLSSLEDGDVLMLFSVVSNSTVPEPGSYGTWIFTAYVLRSGANYREYWRYKDVDGTIYHWNGAAWGAFSLVRAIAIDTEYTLTIAYDPATRSVMFLNDNDDTAETGYMYVPGSDDYWWFSGDAETSNYYGLLQLDYLIVKNTEVTNTFIAHNNLLTDSYHSQHYNGASLWAVNSFTTEVHDTFIAQNAILDYDPVDDSFIALNRIGQTGSQIFTPSVKVLLNDTDVTDMMLSYSIDWAERFVKNLSIDFKPQLPAQIYKRNDANFQTPQIEILVDHDSSGTYVTRGEFFIETISESFSNGKASRRITGRSKAAILDDPFSEQITVTYESTTKRAIVIDLVESVGLTCTWDLPDGPIEYHVFESMTPAEIIIKIVQSIGGRISVDNEDHLYFYACDYTPGNHAPVLSVDSSDIHQVQIVEEMPWSQNKITVSGRASDEAVFYAWAEVELVSVDSRGQIKSSLAADGDDYAVLVATCYDSEGALVVTGLEEEESATPTDAFTISVSKRITADGVVGVWPDTGGGVPGTKIDGPYTFDGSTITTTGAMLDGAHLVTYYGGETCSFSVEGPGVVEETSVIIENGQARTKLYGNELDAGNIYVTATYDGQDSNPVALILGDPRVGDIDANANPSSLQTSETSVITALVYDPDGDPVGNGYAVSFRIIAGSGSLSASSAETTTETIENEEQVSNSYTSIRVENPISSLTSIYALKGDTTEYLGITIDADEIDESYDYATGATTDGQAITLSKALPKSQTRVVVTYTTGGAAQVVYTAPSSVAADGEEVVVEALAGGLNHLVFIDVGRRTSDTSTTSGGKRIGSVTFNVDYTPTSSDRNGTFTLSQQITQISGFDEKLGSYSLDELTRGLENGSVTGIQRIGDNVIATIKADKKDSIRDYYSGNGDYITGNRPVYIKGTNDVPVPNATVTILWDGGDDAADTGGHTEDVTTNSMGVFTFEEGVSGTHNITINHDAVLNPDAPRGLQELSSTIYVAGNVGNDEIRAIDTQVFYEHVTGSFTIPIIYEEA